jgi:hypothetical protein
MGNGLIQLAIAINLLEPLAFSSEFLHRDEKPQREHDRKPLQKYSPSDQRYR